ncbi:hypothetical protein BBR47_35510 [Brevibacillus brevis NBRC 100599]|uniref:PIN like domain-containing protein n=1 Tax=Brevibacillus brevis (strain 47 / JCM 6285 / NBRC 100599) TaxID=358681 RepID=C0ZFG9_BREBN|nr:PIN-like domain-containing protein [Brevibacillus brevis]BAH44528.1 hypothetical protein BBR47_35510 [Brevibacillus brevis NBRC 100599]
MRSRFSGFYRPTNEEFNQLWKECIFVFDTNVLLHVYRYPQQAREALMNIFKHVSDRTWIPHQIGLEYHFRLNEEISKQNRAYEDLQVSLRSKLGEIENKLNQYSRHTNLKVEVLVDKLKKGINEVSQDLVEQKETHPDLVELSNALLTLFEGKIGEAYDSEKLEEIYKDGEKRYDLKVPPGYEDAKKKKDHTKYHDGILYQDQYGDLVFWYQIIDKAKEINKPVILITDDNKIDWWQEHKGETIGPQPELIHEFKRKTNGLKFYMYNSEQFVKFANQYLEIDKSETNIEQVVEDIKKSKIIALEEDSVEKIRNKYSRSFKPREIKQTSLVEYSKEYGAVIKLKSKTFTNIALKDFKDNLSDVYPNQFIEVHKISERQEWIAILVVFSRPIKTSFAKIKKFFETHPVISLYDVIEFEIIDQERENTYNTLTREMEV